MCAFEVGLGKKGVRKRGDPENDAPVLENVGTVRLLTFISLGVAGCFCPKDMSQMNEAQEVKKGPLKVVPGLSSRLGRSYGVSKEAGVQDYSDKSATPTWRPHKCQIGVVAKREGKASKRSRTRTGFYWAVVVCWAVSRNRVFLAHSVPNLACKCPMNVYENWK